MPVLANPRHERFAQEFAKGRSATDAYAEAGFSGHRQNASRLMANDAVASRVRELTAADASGRAILAQQQGGTMEAGALFDTIRDLDHAVYTKAWKRVRQFWQAEEWVRVTEDATNVRFVGLNAPMKDPQTGMPAIDPTTGQPQIQNPVAQLDVDIIVSDAPSSNSLHGEQFQAMVGIAKVSPQMQNLPPEFWIELSDFPHKDKILQMLTKLQQAQSQPDPVKQAAQQAEIENKQADTAQKQATALHKTVLADRDSMGKHLDVHDRMLPAPAAPMPPGPNVLPFPPAQGGPASPLGA